MEIPKIIHYCWFGDNEKSDEIKKYIKTWEKMKGYKIIEWNESNCNFDENEFVKNAYKLKKWAFVSDYIRLKVLYQYGGIYLDTDVEVLKSFDDLLINDMFLGFIYDCSIGTAVIGAKKNNKILKELLQLYNEADISLNNGKIITNFKIKDKINIVNNNDLFTYYLIHNYPQFELRNIYQELDKLTIYPKEYFEQPSFIKGKNYSIHHCHGSWWKTKPGKKSTIGELITKCIGNTLYSKIQCKRKIKKLPYYTVMKKSK